ncbi:MAG: hypothetical protein NC038_06445 [Paludibacter sp.]|nr:hypothetical protein [Bacteroidales bacterium]MCM1069539.1 hypothetical protein [Prevotella sp.]MCM1354185.1 hypothetical protein [Bacteroides sp.]MCM1443076.1 hypothetical protein [Muribaculum sp.]MCM1482259.1 hypothetical protein [Paludibacter sp.]
MSLYFFILKTAALFRRKPKPKATGLSSSISPTQNGVTPFAPKELLLFAQKRPQIIIAFNTHKADEILLARYAEAHPECSLILAPAALSGKRLHQLFNRFKGRYILLSEAKQNNLFTAKMLLIDTPVSLSDVYCYASVIYIGGGFNASLPDVQPFCTYGVPLIFGAYHRKTNDVNEALHSGIGTTFNNYKTLHQTLTLRLSAYDKADNTAS